MSVIIVVKIHRVCLSAQCPDCTSLYHVNVQALSPILLFKLEDDIGPQGYQPQLVAVIFDLKHIH